MTQDLPELTARLTQTRLAIAALTRSRERVQAQITALEQQAAKLEHQAAVARTLGRDDLARAAQARQQDTQSQRAELAVQLGQLLDEEAKLTIAAERLQARKTRIYWSALEDDAERP